jgi:phage tail protein X
MIKVYIAKDGDRIDAIVYAHYGHLRFFEQVLSLNPKLTATLKAGDKVFLPEIKEKAKEQNKLW